MNTQHTQQHVKEEIEKIITEHPIVLFMKGSPQFPQCGFSGLSVQVLKTCGVHRFHSVDVLQDNSIRQGIKEYTNWPTIPQLYVNGEFIGGSDIMMEMHKSGELKKLLAPYSQTAQPVET